jgi:hypothetical protein
VFAKLADRVVCDRAKQEKESRGDTVAHSNHIRPREARRDGGIDGAGSAAEPTGDRTKKQSDRAK